MGGKKKANNPQPRTKGNVKPSSSEKAANFLVQHTGSLAAFNTNVFDSSMFNYQPDNTRQIEQPIQATLPNFVPIVQDPEASSLDVRLVGVLKRLDKKDHVTKQKALREFLELMKTESKDSPEFSDSEVWTAVLPFWPRLYSRLSFDSDRKVRELTQSVMHALASRVGRNLAPYLKQIFPTWTFATVDSHEQAATLAYNGLHDTFPGTKLSDANRLYAGVLIDLVDNQLQEIRHKSVSSKSPSGSSKPKSSPQHSIKTDSPIADFFLLGMTTNRTDESSTSLTNPDYEQRTNILKLGATLRFLTSFIDDLGSMAEDNECLIRTKNLLAPGNLWSVIAIQLNLAKTCKSGITESTLSDEYTSYLYGSTYKLCTKLCRDYDWRQWLIGTDQGQELAHYICLITVGSLGYSSKSDYNPMTSPKLFSESMLIWPPCCHQTNVCFSHHWEASLSCLASLSKSFVWSKVDWRKTLVPRLDYLLSRGGLGQAKQVYPNLLCLLNEFPIDYSSLSEDEQEILGHLFIDSSLKGLIMTLQSSSALIKSLSVTNESLSITTMGSFFDPSILVVMVTGILESARYLIDRLLTAISSPTTTNMTEVEPEQQQQQSSPLTNRIFHEIILRLLSDSLNLYRPTPATQEGDADNQHIMRLVCTHTPESRQAYLDAVFTQIAQLCNNLAESKIPAKEHLFATIRNHLLSWIKETTLIDSHAHVTRLYIGIIDPLRFGRFIDALAKAGTRKFGHQRKPMHLTTATTTLSQITTKKSIISDAKLLIVSADWCVELFQTFAEILESQITDSNIDNGQSKCFHTVLFLSIYGYLPLIQIPIPNLLGHIFTSVLSELPTEVHTLCWSPSVIRGLAKTWIHTVEPIDQIGVPQSSSVCLDFIHHILPSLLNSLPSYGSKSVDPDSSDSLFNHVLTLLCHWIRTWFAEALQTTNLMEISSSLNKIQTLLGTGLQNSNQSSDFIGQLFAKLIIFLSDQLDQYSNSIKSKSILHLRIIATVYLNFLEIHLKFWKSYPQLMSKLNQSYLTFGQILFHFYTLQICGFVNIDSNKKSKLHNLKHFQSELSHEYHDDLIVLVDLLLTIPEFIDRAEILIMNRLILEFEYHKPNQSDSFVHDFFDSCFEAIVQFPIINPTFLLFLNRLQDSFNQQQQQQKLMAPHFNSNLINIWIKHIHEQTLSILELFHNMYESNLCSRHLLPCLDLCPISMISQLAPVVKLHLTGLHLKFYLKLDDQLVKHYIFLFGLLRVWMSSLSEPVDWGIDFGWPMQIDLHDSSIEPMVPIMNSYLELTNSIFGNNWDGMIKKLGQFWYHLTSNQTIEDLFLLIDQFPINDNRYFWTKRYSFWNALLFNRIRTLHPNLWPRQLKLAASLTNDNQTGQSWLDTYILNLVDKSDPMHQDALIRLCELFVPSGVVGRCFPRQELLVRLKSISYDKEFKMTDSEDGDNIIRSRILELLSCMTSIRFAAPIYITTFMPLIFDDLHSWLVSLADAASELDLSTQTLPPFMLRASLSFMTFVESLLMLWQPWQWCTDMADKSPLSNHVGLVQLSLRIRELRPNLTQTQWDFILCSTIGWVNTTITWLNQPIDTDQTKVWVLSFKAFRLAAALGAMFTKKSVCLNSMSSLISLKSNPKIEIESWENMDDVDIEDDESPDDQNLPIDSDESSLTIPKPSSDNFPTDYEGFDLETMEDLIEHDDNNNDDDTDQEQSLDKALNQGMPLIPQRGQIPNSVQSDWANFFSNHLYSALLPMIFKFCLPNQLAQQTILPNCENHIQALCASFATCSPNQLIQILTDKPQLVMEFLVDIQLNSSKFVPHQIIQSRKSATFDLSPGLRSSLDLACKLIARSPHQPGQLLGHILLNRIFALKATSSSNAKLAISLGNYLVHRLPNSWLSLLYGLFPPDLESYLLSEMALDMWGRGSIASTYLISNSIENGFVLNQENHQTILAYLLAWDALLNLLSCVGPQTRACLQNALLGPSIAYFDRFILLIGLLLPPSAHLETLADAINRLEPDERLLLPNSSTRMSITAALSICSSKRRIRRPIRLMIPTTSGDDKEWRDAFLPDDSLLSLPGHRSASDLTHFAARLFRRFLAEAPSLMRSWHTQLTSNPNPQLSELKPNESVLSSSSSSSPSNLCDTNSFTSLITMHRIGRLRQFATLMDKLVTKHFSLGLARDHVISVQYKSHLRLLQEEQTSSSSKGLFSILNSTPEVGSVRITGYPLSRELIASYHMTDEHSMNILIQLPENYPLSPVTVEKSRGIGVSSQQWQSWICQLSVFINNHNGSILGGIDLWQKNARKKFEGVEECAICYSVVHSTGFTLPKMKCHTCRKLFHHACMYRWFQTSKNPACPLCRHIFFRPSGRPA